MLIDRIEIGALFAIDFDIDESVVHRRGDLGILEAFMRHHMAPVTGGITDRKQNEFVFRARPGERVIAPGHPRDGIVLVLEQIRARFTG